MLVLQAAAQPTIAQSQLLLSSSFICWTNMTCLDCAWLMELGAQRVCPRVSRVRWLWQARWSVIRACAGPCGSTGQGICTHLGSTWLPGRKSKLPSDAEGSKAAEQEAETQASRSLVFPVGSETGSLLTSLDHVEESRRSWPTQSGNPS